MSEGIDIDIQQTDSEVAQFLNEQLSFVPITLSSISDSFNSAEEMTDQVYALIFNEEDKALILEAPPKGHGWPEWQLVCDAVPAKGDPLPFAKQKLLEVAGYASNEWFYLGSYRLSSAENSGAGHFFCARKAIPANNDQPSRPLRWVGLPELRHGLIDGRVSSLNFAITISLALLLK